MPQKRDRDEGAHAGRRAVPANASARLSIASLTGLRAWKLGIAGPSAFWYFPVFFVILSSGPLHPSGPTGNQVGLAALVLVLMVSGSWGFLLNDLFDREADAAGGRSDGLHGHQLSARVIWVLIGATAAFSWGTVFLIGGDCVFKAVLAINYLVAILYSVPPFKLKVKGFWGFAANTLMERPMPILVLLSYLGYYTVFTIILPVLMEMTWSVFKHQAADVKEDTYANVRTLAVTLGEERSNRIVHSFLNPLSVFSLLSLIGLAWVVIPDLRFVLLPTFVFILLGFVGTYLAEKIGRLNFYATPTDPPYIMFLNFSYRYIILPVLALGILALNPEYNLLVLLLAVTLAAQVPGYIKMAYTMAGRRAAPIP